MDIGAFESASVLLSQSIDFPPIANQVYPVASITLSATDTAGLTVQFAVLSGPANIIDGNVLIVTGVGTVEVEASQPGNATYSPAVPVDQSFVVQSGTVYTVDATSDTGTGAGNAGDLLYCVTQANNNDKPLGSLIEFDPTVFISSQSYIITLASTLQLSETAGPEVIAGPGAGIVTISGGNAVNVFQVNSGALATLSGLTISGGSATVYDGGAGVNVQAGAMLTVAESMVVDNTSRGDGGGIENNGTLTVIGSTIAGNSAVDGGGILSVGQVLVMDSTLSGNFAYDGGAILSYSTLTVTNSTIAGNSTYYNGAGLFNYSTATIVNSTIAYNEVEYDPGGGAGIDTYPYATTILNNTIVALNTDGSGTGATADDVAGATVSLSSEYNLVGADLTGSLAGGTGNQVGVTDPGLGTLASYGGPTQTILLLPDSPAIGGGSYALAVDPQGNPLSYDQRGVGYPRSYSGAIDIGAFEKNPNQQTIDFPAIPDQLYLGEPITLTLNATASSGLSVTFAVLSGPATVSGDILTITGAGTVEVEASQAGNTTIPAAFPVDQTFSVSLPSVTTTVSSSVNPSVDGQDVTFTANLAAVGTFEIPSGYVFFYVNNVFQSYVYETDGTAASSTVALVAGTYSVEVYYDNEFGDFSNSSGTLAGGQVVNAVTAQSLQQVLESTPTPDDFGREQ